MAEDHVILAVGKIHGKGRLQISKEVRDFLKLQDGDRVYFIQEENRVFISKAPAIKAEKIGKYQ